MTSRSTTPADEAAQDARDDAEMARLYQTELAMPRDLTNAAGTFSRERAMSIRPCAKCRRGIHVGRERINHHLLATSSVTDYYHPECVVLP